MSRGSQTKPNTWRPSGAVTSVPQYDCTYHPLPPSDYLSQYSSDCSDYSRPLLGA